MLSNPNSGLQQRQRQHRRQNSTPAAFDAPKVPILPAKIQRQSSHRRGQSLDQRNIRQRQLRPQDDETHILRETQQQRLARPGQQQRQYLVSQGQQDFSQYQGAVVGSCPDSFSRPNSQGENLFQNGHHDVQRFNNLSGGRVVVPNPAMGDFQNLSSMTENGYLDNLDLDLDLVVDENGRDFRNLMSTPSVIRERSAGTAQAYAAHRRQNSSQEDPRTPPNQIRQDTYPITPATTPYNRVPQTEPGPKWSVEYSFLDGEETVKPTRSQKGMSCRDIFQQGTFTQEGSIPSPPESTRLPLSHNFDVAPMQSPGFMNMASLQMEFSGSETGYDSSYYSPMSSALSPSQGSFQSSPELANMPLFDEAGEPIGDFPIMNIYSTLPSSPPDLDSVQGKSPQKADPAAGATIIEDLGLDATIEDTGVTVDDIATFINGPGEDGKYTCLFLDCGKRFGRKENIKSHVQTHLGDRQFRCNHCKKCFVRQHDLKRHAKIHSGVKPYPCQCGNSFARHDALTRHRQRGMCVGAFEGVVKKIVKRGRPRKHRPDGGERRDKASRTRKRVQDMSSGSSTSGDSQGYLSQSPHMPFAHASSPESSTFDHLSPMIEQCSPVLWEFLDWGCEEAG
ncbi:MAG: hypothetical protein M1824_002029 [Vezdaea acicularis]|nr:MAG: hypothetical protein M1824_002029 [Vezdaea acicularis]